MSEAKGNGVIQQRWKAIYEAAGEGRAEDLKKALKHRAARVDFQQRFDKGELTATPLTAAAHGGHVECVKILLDANATINLAASSGSTPLSLACQQGHEHVGEMLLVAGADINQPKTNGCTPLYMASERGTALCVQMLLGAGASVDQAATTHTPESRAGVGVVEGATPLYAAASEGKVDTCKLLLSAGAVVGSETVHGATPLIGACMGNPCSRSRSGANRAKVVALLLAADADWTQPTCKEKTALEWAREDAAAGLPHGAAVAEAMVAPRASDPHLGATVSADDSDLVSFAGP